MAYRSKSLDWKESEELFGRAYGFAEAGDLDKAISVLFDDGEEDLRHAFSDPSSENHALYLLGCYHLKLGQNRSAVRFFKKAISVWPQDCDSYVAISNCDVLSEDVIEVMRQGTVQCPRDDRIAVNLANILFDLEKYEEAKEVAMKVNKSSEYYSVVSILMDKINGIT